MPEPPEAPGTPYLQTSFNRDPMERSRTPPDGPGGEDYGTFDDDWGVFTLIGFAGACVAGGGLLIGMGLGTDAFLLGVLFGVLLAPLVFGALPAMVLGYPAIGAGAMMLSGIVAVDLPNLQFDASVAFGVVGAALLVLGIVLAWRYYLHPRPIRATETATAVFHWND